MACVEAFVRESFARTGLDPSCSQLITLQRLMERVVSDRTITRVASLEAESGLSARTLQRLFREWVGVSPKWVINRERMHEALAQIEDRSTIDWAALALDLGYFDQAHFIKDFRACIGVSPATYATSQQSS